MKGQGMRRKPSARRETSDLGYIVDTAIFTGLMGGGRNEGFTGSMRHADEKDAMGANVCMPTGPNWLKEARNSAHPRSEIAAPPRGQ
jgi:hypothetical protein